MVQVIENRTELEAVVEARKPHPTSPGHELLEVTIRSARAVPGLADLLSQRVGQRLDLLVPTDRLPAGPLTGFRLRGQVALAGPGVVRLDTRDLTGLTLEPPPP
jgi:hypothetical protein